MGMFGMGQPVPRTEDPRLLKGCGQYVSDLKFPDMVWGYTVRSPFAHADILAIDTDAAKASPPAHEASMTAEAATTVGTATLRSVRARRDESDMASLSDGCGARRGPHERTLWSERYRRSMPSRKTATSCDVLCRSVSACVGLVSRREGQLIAFPRRAAFGAGRKVPGDQADHPQRVRDELRDPPGAGPVAASRQPSGRVSPPGLLDRLGEAARTRRFRRGLPG